MMTDYISFENLLALTKIGVRLFCEKPNEEPYVKSINDLSDHLLSRSAIDKLIDKIINDPELSSHEKAKLIDEVESQFYARVIETKKASGDIIDRGMDRRVGRTLAFIGGVAVLSGTAYAIDRGMHNCSSQLRIVPRV